MRARRFLIAAAALSASLVARSGIARAECDPAKPIEPFASRFEVMATPSMTRVPISPGHDAAMGNSGQKMAAALAPSSCWTGTAPWDCTCRVTQIGDFRSETNSKASWHRTARSRRSMKRCFPGHRRSSTGQARQADRPMRGSCSFGPACQRGIF